MSARSRERQIEVHHDNFTGEESYTAAYDYEQRSWLLDADTAADFVANWTHRSVTRVAKRVPGALGWALAAVSSSDPLAVMLWQPTRDNEYALSEFPFRDAFEVTTPIPVRVTPTEMPSRSAFQVFGEEVAKLFASSTRWDADTTSTVAELAQSLLRVSIDTDTMKEADWLMWRGLVGPDMPDYEGE
jgi:hypothetical protein